MKKDNDNEAFRFESSSTICKHGTRLTTFPQILFSNNLTDCPDKSEVKMMKVKKKSKKP